LQSNSEIDKKLIVDLKQELADHKQETSKNKEDIECRFNGQQQQINQVQHQVGALKEESRIRHDENKKELMETVDTRMTAYEMKTEKRITAHEIETDIRITDHEKRLADYREESEQRRSLDKKELQTQIQNTEEKSKSRMACYQQEIDQVKAVTVDHQKQLAIVKQKTPNLTQGMYIFRQFENKQKTK